jgi:uncharacterized RDD family membrane protein YckC
MEASKPNFPTNDFENVTITPVIAWEVKPIDWSKYFQPEKNLFKRAAANIIDYTIIGVMITPVYFYIEHLFQLLNGGTYGFSPHQEKYEILEFILQSFNFLSIFVGYYYFLYKFKTTTVGKKYFNLKTYRYHSFEPIGLIRIIARELVFKFLELAVLPATIIHFLIQKEGLFIHDVLTKTIVVKENP